MFFFTASMYKAETVGNGNSLTTGAQQETRHNGGNCGTFVSHFKVVEREGRQRLGSGQPTGQRHSEKYSAFNTGNQISFPLLSCSDLYMEIACVLQSAP